MPLLCKEKVIPVVAESAIQRPLCRFQIVQPPGWYGGAERGYSVSGNLPYKKALFELRDGLASFSRKLFF